MLSMAVQANHQVTSSCLHSPAATSNLQHAGRCPLADHADEYQCKVQNIMKVMLLYIFVRGFRTCYCCNRLVRYQNPDNTDANRHIIISQLLETKQRQK